MPMKKIAKTKSFPLKDRAIITVPPVQSTGAAHLGSEHRCRCKGSFRQESVRAPGMTRPFHAAALEEQTSQRRQNTRSASGQKQARAAWNWERHPKIQHPGRTCD